jgi:ParB-like chromosome segregation protein Spo0J
VSFAVNPGPEPVHSPGTVEVAINRIRGFLGARTGGLDQKHVALLMETADQWPPIVVWRDRGLVVDGGHRVEAARRLGHTTIRAIRFEGTRNDAFLESVHRNAEHGLPLSVGDRRRAAARVLVTHPDWSDRRIGVSCGLSNKTVARVRQESPAGQEAFPPATERTSPADARRRVGLDGKARPVDGIDVRERIREALDKNPEASLRAIARMAEASPETVRSVRARHPADATLASRMASPLTMPTQYPVVASSSMLIGPLRDESDIPGGVGTETTNYSWGRDLALLTCGDNGDFAQWFESNDIHDVWHRFVWVIPVNRIYDIVDEARRRAHAWTNFASTLESRTR